MDKKKRLGRMLLLIFIIALLTLNPVYALGVTPGRTSINFEPNLQRTVGYSVINSEHRDMDIVIYTTGELAKYITLDQERIKMNANEESRQLSYNIKLPDKLTPGLHTADIIVLQLPDKAPIGESFVGATLAVATQLYVQVPYPGRYVEGQMTAITKDKEEHFIIAIHNLGEFDLNSVKANIDIYKGGNRIDSIYTNEISIKSKERKEIMGKWIYPDVGDYKAIVTMIYDGETITIEKEFKIGEMLLELQSIEVRNFILGDIAKFEMLVENKWSEQISNSYSQTNVFNDRGDLMADFKSQTYDIPAKTKKVMTSYWDTQGVKVGTYDAKVYLKYLDKSDQNNVKFRVSENNIQVIGLGYVIKNSPAASSSDNITHLLVLLIAVLIAINFIWFVLLRKRISAPRKESRESQRISVR